MSVTRLCVLMLVAVRTVSSAPASAEPPERSEEPVFFVFRDPETRFIVFVNITNEDACAWEASGFEGPPPVERLVTVQRKATGEGEVESFHAETSIQVWRVAQPVVDADGPNEQIQPLLVEVSSAISPAVHAA